MIFFPTLFLSMFITIVLIPILREAAVYVNAVDIPDDRKIHATPMPKIGGLGMAMGTFIPILMWAQGGAFIRSILIGAGIVAAEGFIDDTKGLGYKTKFVAQIAAALVVILYGGVKIRSLGVLLPGDYLFPEGLAIILTVFVIVGITNAINLSDGLDGLAGGITLLSFICIGYLAYSANHMIIAFFCMAVAGAIFGFLRFNTHPASVFMGDTGSQLLGFLAITLSLSLTQDNTPLSPLLPLIILGFPVLDTLTVMGERMANGKSMFVADKNHFHHKLMRLGLFHSEAVVVIYVLQSILILVALFFRYYSEWPLLIFYLLFSGLIISGSFWAEKTGWQAKRYDLLDVAIKGKLRLLRERQTLIKGSFFILKYGLLLLFLMTCITPSNFPKYFSVLSLVMAGTIIMALKYRNKWITGALRLSLYLTIPYLVYLSQANPAGWITSEMMQVLNVFFGGMIFFSVLTIKFTRRKKGFKATPMDFLILFIALVVPNLSGLQTQVHHVNLLAVKIIGLLFGYEIVIGELRGEFGKFAVSTVICFLVVFVKGIV